MSPTLWDNDVILCTFAPEISNQSNHKNNKGGYESSLLSIHDIIIFKSTNHSDQNWIKRITKVVHYGTTLNLTTMNINDVRSILVGDSNDFVIRNNTFYINGKKSTTYTPKQNFYYVNGDNKKTSYDSRYFGYIPQSRVIAIAQYGLLSIHCKKLRLFFTLKQQYKHEND